MALRVGKADAMRAVVCVGIREWPRPSGQHDVTVGPAVRMAMDLSSMPMKDRTGPGHTSREPSSPHDRSLLSTQASTVPRNAQGVTQPTAPNERGCSPVGRRWQRLPIQALVGLLPLPFADLKPCHTAEEAVLVTDPEVPGWEPPFDSPPDRRAPAPTAGLTSALVVVRVVDALEQRPLRH